MADGIKIGSLDISAFKVGNASCKIYLGDTLLYPQSQPQTLQWVEYSNGDTIPSDLDIYGVSGTGQNLLDTFDCNIGTNKLCFQPSRRNVEYYIYGNDGTYCTSGVEAATDPIELIFSNIGCFDYINQGATVSGTIKLYIYA